MRWAGLSGMVRRRRRRRTTVSAPGVRTAPDLVARDFNPIAPDRLWCADITYVDAARRAREAIGAGRPPRSPLTYRPT
jgi:transposase InsO family protein